MEEAVGIFARPSRFLSSRINPGTRLSWDDRGQALVDATLAMIPFLMLLFGVIELALGLYTYHFISYAAREGTRYAIVRGSSCTSVAEGCPATQASIQSYVKGLGFVNPNRYVYVKTTWSAGTQTTCSPSTTCNNPGNLVTVSIQYQYPLTLPFVSVTNVTMNSTSQMLISQ
jgi:Flp pilus assembly protein TadG